jgi:hypothetical protein
VTISSQTFPETYFNEEFEDGISFENWTNQSISGSALWTLGSGLAYGSILSSYEGQSNLRFHSFNYNGDETRLISPAIDLSGAHNPVLKFRHIQPVWSSDQDELSVYYKVSADSEWILLSEYKSNIDSWMEEIIVLPDASSEYFISFVGKSGYGYGIGIDNLMIVTGLDCGEPKNFSFVNVKETSALVRWQNSDNQTFELEYGLQGFVPGSGERVSFIQSNSLQLNNLTAGVNYDIYLRAYCNDGVSNWVGPYAFTTDCEIGLTLPYTEGFENTENPLECWQVLYANNNHPSENDVIVDNTESYNGQNSFRFSSYAVGSPYDQYLISPSLNVGANTEISFKYKTLNGSSESFVIGFSTNPINPLSSISWNEVIANAGADWKEYKTLIPEGSKYIVVHYQSVYEYYLFIDDIRIGFPIDCNTATDLSVVDKGSDFAQLSWTESENIINLEFGEHGFAKGTGTKSYNIVDNTAILQDLIPNTQYDAYVLTDCEGAIIYSEVVSFVTDGICELISGINTDQITNTTAIISWNIAEFQTEFNIEFGLSGFLQGTGTVINNSFSPALTLTSLLPDTEYDIYVQAHCSAFGGLSDWSEKFNFKTLKDIIDDNSEYVLEDIYTEPLSTEMLISVEAVEPTSFICDYDQEVHHVELRIVNEGTEVVPAGTEIKYSVNYQSKSIFINESVILSSDLLPGQVYQFSTLSGFTFNADQNVVKITLNDDFKRINNKTVTITFIKIWQGIEFLNAENNTIEVTQLPIEIESVINSNADLFGLNNSFSWNNGENTNTIIANTEGIYTLMVSNEYCSTTKTVTLKLLEEGDGNDLPINYDIYPNPSNGQFNVTNPDPSVAVSLVVYDSAGRKVYSSVLVAAEQQINLTGLAAGVYNAVFTENENVVLKRLFIE